MERHRQHAFSAAFIKLIYGITDTYGIAALIFSTIAKAIIPAFKIYNSRFGASHFLLFIVNRAYQKYGNNSRLSMDYSYGLIA